LAFLIFVLRFSTAELSLAYRILVPEQRRRVCSAEEVSPRDGQRRDLRPVLQQHIELILPVGLVDQVVAGVVE